MGVPPDWQRVPDIDPIAGVEETSPTFDVVLADQPGSDAWKCVRVIAEDVHSTESSQELLDDGVEIRETKDVAKENISKPLIVHLPFGDATKVSYDNPTGPIGGLHTTEYLAMKNRIFITISTEIRESSGLDGVAEQIVKTIDVR
jgi:hypothetical protein